MSDSEIQLVAASVGDNWPTLAALLGITEDDYKLFDVSYPTILLTSGCQCTQVRWLCIGITSGIGYDSILLIQIPNFLQIVSSDPYGHVLAMLQFWVAEKKEYATSEELNNAVKILNSKTQGEDEDKTEKTETIKYL